eukprot:3735878-Prymnesium_polylepis.2
MSVSRLPLANIKRKPHDEPGTSRSTCTPSYMSSSVPESTRRNELASSSGRHTTSSLATVRRCARESSEVARPSILSDAPASSCPGRRNSATAW